MPLTNVYVDGFNLYYGAVRRTRYKWLDLRRLFVELLPRNEIAHIHYFTALVKNSALNPHASLRQQIFIRALETLPDLTVHYGSFLSHPTKMPLVAARDAGERDDANLACLESGGPRRALVMKTEEKGSDVNLAAILLADAFRGNFEAAAVVSNDSDLVLPIKIVTQELGLPVGIVNPRERFSYELKQVASFKRTIPRRLLRTCQFPDRLRDRQGTITKPAEW